MNKIFGLLITLLFLNGCAESIALLGSSASNGRIVQSSVNSAISYGVKKQTGKTPIEHAFAFAEEKNPEKKKVTCNSYVETTRSEFCPAVKKKITITSNALIEKTSIEKLSNIVKEYPRKKTKKISEIEKIAKKSVIYNRR